MDAPSSEAPQELTSRAEIKAWLRSARKRANPPLSQREIADQLERSTVTVNRWESADAPEVPSLKDLAKIAKACHLPMPTVTCEMRAHGHSKHRESYLAGATMTLREEILEVGRVLASRAFDPTNQERNASMFLARYGGDGPEVGTLQSIGDQHGMTRERVRQIVDRMLGFLGAVKLPTQRFDAVYAACGELQSQPAPAAEEALRPLLGDGLTLRGAQDYGVEILGRSLPFHWLPRRNASPLLAMGGAPEWYGSALYQSRRLIYHSGAALMTLAWAVAQREAKTSIDFDEFQRLLSHHIDFEWLDEAQGWFWFGPDGSGNRLIVWALEILSTADRAMDIEELYAGMARYDRKRESQIGALASGLLPPMSIVLQVLSRVPGIRTKQGDDLYLENPGEVSTELRSGATRQVVDALRTLGGVGSRGQMLQAIKSAGESINAITFSVALSDSPLLRLVTRGVYAIRGWPVEPASFAAAVQAIHANRIPANSTSTPSPTATGWTGTLSAGSLRNRQVSVPAAVTRGVPDGAYRLDDGASVRLTSAGAHTPRANGLVRILEARGATVGSRYQVDFDVGAGTVSVQVLPDPATPDPA